jgi:BlaI family penicillinase repressor
MAMGELNQLSRRERQIMEIVFAKGETTASDVLERLPDAPSRTAVRTFLRILEHKGHLKHKKRGREFVYRTTSQREQAGRSAFRRLLETFFGGSLERALAAHLADPRAKTSIEEMERLLQLVKKDKSKIE